MDENPPKPNITTPSVDKKRARKKFMSEQIAMHLAQANPESSLYRSYIRSTHCMEVLEPNAEGKLVAHYCKNRWCPVCQSIRIAVLINGYKPQLQKLKDPYFITLTRPTCTEEQLPWQIKHMAKCWNTIKNRKTFRQIGLKGLRKAECTIRPHGLYHYHFHIIAEGGREVAEKIVQAWLELNPDSKDKAQYIEPIDCNKTIELFKYFTKLCAKDPDGTRRMMDWKRLDVIFRALRGKRVYQPFGGLSMVSEEIEDQELEAVREIADQAYQWMVNDWYGVEEGDSLTNYNPSQALIDLFEGPTTDGVDDS